MKHGFIAILKSYSLLNCDYKLLVFFNHGQIIWFRDKNYMAVFKSLEILLHLI